MPASVPALRASVVYRDPRGAIAFLEAAFGFELALLVEGDDGEVAHCQMRFGDSQVLVSRAWPGQCSPLDVGGRNTQTVSVQLHADIDSHFRRAKAAGAEVVLEPQTSGTAIAATSAAIRKATSGA